MSDLTRRTCEDVLARNGMGRLACYSPSQHECYIVPVAYSYEDGEIYLDLVPGQKLEYLQENPYGVSLEVEEVHDGSTWRTVIVTGDFSRLEQNVAEGHARRGPLRPIFAQGLAPYASERLVRCKLTVQKISGKQDTWAWRGAFPGLVAVPGLA